MDGQHGPKNKDAGDAHRMKAAFQHAQTLVAIPQVAGFDPVSQRTRPVLNAVVSTPQTSESEDVCQWVKVHETEDGANIAAFAGAQLCIAVETSALVW